MWGIKQKDVLWTAGEAEEIVLGETGRELPCSKPVFSKVNFRFLQKVDFMVLMVCCYVNDLHENFLESEHLLRPMERFLLTLMCFGSGPKCK